MILMAGGAVLIGNGCMQACLRLDAICQGFMAIQAQRVCCASVSQAMTLRAVIDAFEGAVGLDELAWRDELSIRIGWRKTHTNKQSGRYPHNQFTQHPLDPLQ